MNNKVGDCRMKEDGKTIRCPECGSDKVFPVHPFDYIKQCKKCKHEFITKYHN